MAAVVDQGVDVDRAATAVVDQGGPSVGDGNAEGHAADDDVVDRGTEAPVLAMAVQRAMLLMMMLLTGARRPGDDHVRCRVFPLRIVKLPITMEFTDQSLILCFFLKQQHQFNVIAYLLVCKLAK